MESNGLEDIANILRYRGITVNLIASNLFGGFDMHVLKIKDGLDNVAEAIEYLADTYERVNTKED